MKVTTFCGIIIALCLGTLFGYFAGYSTGLEAAQTDRYARTAYLQSTIVPANATNTAITPAMYAAIEGLPTPIPRLTPTPAPTYKTLAYGDEGEEVKQMQARLNALGYSCGNADGIYGTKTRAAVEHFQRINGLPISGMAGKYTLARLFSEKALPQSYTPPPTRKPTPQPTPKPTPKPTPTPKPEKTVYITRTGERYHSRANCGNSTYVTEVTLSYARSMGYTACGNCYR